MMKKKIKEEQSTEDVRNQLNQEKKRLSDELTKTKVKADSAKNLASLSKGETPAITQAERSKNLSDSQSSTLQGNEIRKKIKDIDVKIQNLSKTKDLEQKQDIPQTDLSVNEIIQLVKESEKAIITKTNLIETVRERLNEDRPNRDVSNKLNSGNNDLAKIFNNPDIIKQLGDESFSEILNNLKDKTGKNNPNISDSMMTLMQGLNNANRVEFSGNNKQKLEKLSIDFIRSQYNIPEDFVEIKAQLKPVGQVEKGNLKIRKGNKRPPQSKPTEELQKEISKRRILNSMAHGAARKGQNIFHMITNTPDPDNPNAFVVDNETYNLVNRLKDDYSKINSGNDFNYWMIDDDTLTNEAEHGTHAGNVVTGRDTDGKPYIKAQAVTFPLLLHELVKGVMEILSWYGRPLTGNEQQDKEVWDYIEDQTDTAENESWDIRIGPKIWESFVSNLDLTPEEQSMVYRKVAELPADEFLNIIHGLIKKDNQTKEKLKNIVDEVIGDLYQSDVEDDNVDYTEDDLESDIDDVNLSLDDLFKEPKQSTQNVDYKSLPLSTLRQMMDDALDNGDYELVGKLDQIIQSKGK